ncbi:MAG TPA: ATPase, partial [Nakamurella sp.]|nr:ATPase [Nakamurella sp.]
IAACFDAFNERRELTGDDLLHEIDNTVPLSVTQAEQIAALRAWADIRAVAASAPEDRAGYATRDLAAVPPVVDPQAALARGGRPVEA